MVEHQVAFIQALRSGHKMRKRMFDTIEQRHKNDFVRSRRGMGLYEDLLSAVRVSGVPEAVDEFESRFLPLLDSDQTRGDADVGAQEEMAQHGTTEMQNRRWAGRVGISALCLAALVTALIVGVRVISITAAEQPGSRELTITAAKPTEPASETMSEGEQAVVVRASVPAMDVTEPASETIAEPVPAISVEQKLADD
ncbi:MAG: hypothetical protein WAN75_25945 [Xanthobacteraceae bacterium]